MWEHPQVDLHRDKSSVAGIEHACDTHNLAVFTAQERAQVSPGAWRAPHSNSPRGSSATCMNEHAAHWHRAGVCSFFTSLSVDYEQDAC